MNMGIKAEKLLLAECAVEGAILLNQHSKSNFSEYFSEQPLFHEFSTTLPSNIEQYLYHNSVDIYFSFLSVILINEAVNIKDTIIQGKNVRLDLNQALNYLEKQLYSESKFESDLTKNIHEYSALSDDEIKTNFNNKFSFNNMDLLSFPTDKTVFFAKVNHGYWEYMRGAYDENYNVRHQFREFDIQCRIRRLKSSALSQNWGQCIQHHFSDNAFTTPTLSPLFVNLTSGTETITKSLNKQFTPVIRGTAIGLLSMFNTVLPNVNNNVLGDGIVTRTLIEKQQLEEFFEKYVADTDACLFIIPPHLKLINFVNFKGVVHKFLIPPTRINETWKVVTVALLGYLVRMSKKYRTITILAQGASVISLIALLFSSMDVFANNKLRFFDLGRILDITVPDILSKQSWTRGNDELYIKEGQKVFLNEESNKNFTLVTKV